MAKPYLLLCLLLALAVCIDSKRYKRWKADLVRPFLNEYQRGDFRSHGKFVPKNITGALCQVHDDCEEPEHQHWRKNTSKRIFSFLNLFKYRRMGEQGAPSIPMPEISADDPSHTAQYFYDNHVRPMKPVIIRGFHKQDSQ